MNARRWLMRGIGLVPALLTAACGGSVETGGSGGHGSSSGSSGSGSGSGSGSTTASASTTTSASSGGSGAECGGFPGKVCAADEFCDFPDDICGAADGPGVCHKRPMGCTADYSPACGCDGKVYGNACGANGAGWDVSNLGGCPPPAGMFACGSRFCAVGKNYCVKTLTDVGGTPDSYTCAALPAACGATPTCACLAAVSCGNTCATVPSGGGLFVTCPGG